MINVRRIAVQGLLAGQGALSIATQGFHPLAAAIIPGSGGRFRVPRGLIDAQRRKALEADDLLLIVAGAVAAGILH